MRLYEAGQYFGKRRQTRKAPLMLVETTRSILTRLSMKKQEVLRKVNGIKVLEHPKGDSAVGLLSINSVFHY